MRRLVLVTVIAIMASVKVNCKDSPLVIFLKSHPNTVMRLRCGWSGPYIIGGVIAGGVQLGVRPTGDFDQLQKLSRSAGDEYIKTNDDALCTYCEDRVPLTEAERSQGAHHVFQLSILENPDQAYTAECRN